MDIDPTKQRRNLLVVSLALVAYEIGGGTVSQLSFLGGGITLKEPEVIIKFVYFAMAYTLWRYWLYAKPDHEKFRVIVNQKVESSPEFIRYKNPLVAGFKDRSGVSRAEGWQSFLDESDTTQIKPIEVQTSIHFGIFKRKLEIRVDSPKGEYNPDHEVHNLPFWLYEILRLRALATVTVADKTFSDLYVPYAPVFLAVGIHWYRAVYA